VISEVSLAGRVASGEAGRLNIPLIVRRTVLHARKLSPAYEWPVAREALVRILTDLEARGDDPSLDRLHGIIQRGDQQFFKLGAGGSSPPGETQRPDPKNQL
jgi:hypothetical protein